MYREHLAQAVKFKNGWWTSRKGQLYVKEYTGCCENAPGRATAPRSSNSSVSLIFKLRSLDEVTQREKPQREGEARPKIRK
jgi:hypothetical protein